MSKENTIINSLKDSGTSEKTITEMLEERKGKSFNGDHVRARKVKQLTLQEIINQAKGLPNADLKTLDVAIASEIETRRHETSAIIQTLNEELEELK